MANEQQADKADLEQQPSPSAAESKGDDVVSIDLPAPQGWTKKFIPKKGGTPRRNEIVFIAPTSEEIKNRRQLDQFLKSHSGGPSASEFDWTTGDTPRRSARLSSRSKATDTPETESGSSRKRQKKSSSKTEEEKKVETDGEGESAEDVADANKSEEGEDVEMKDVKVTGDHSEEEKSKEATTEDADSAEASVKNLVEKDDLEKQEHAQVLEDTVFDKGEEDQPEENKPDANAGLPKEYNSAVEEKPGETTEKPGENPAESQVQPEVAVSSINNSLENDVNVADKGNEGSKQEVEDPEKKDSLELGEVIVSAKESNESAEHTENQALNHDGAPHEPNAAPSVSC